MSSIISILDTYETDTAALVGGEYTIGDSLYLTAIEMWVTNNVAFAITDIGTGGVIGVCEEAPDLTATRDRMVLRLTCGDALLTPIKDALRAQEL